MKIHELYEIADENDVRVDDFRLADGMPSLSVRMGRDYSVALDLSQLDGEGALKTAFAHELGHCMTDSFYNERNILDIRSRQEYRADKWAVKALIPKDELEAAMKSGCSEVWQLAEYFGVDEQLIKKAAWIYFDRQI